MGDQQAKESTIKDNGQAQPEITSGAAERITPAAPTTPEGTPKPLGATSPGRSHRPETAQGQGVDGGALPRPSQSGQGRPGQGGGERRPQGQGGDNRSGGGSRRGEQRGDQGQQAARPPGTGDGGAQPGGQRPPPSVAAPTGRWNGPGRCARSRSRRQPVGAWRPGTHPQDRSVRRSVSTASFPCPSPAPGRGSTGNHR